jgi:hypothetical protein
VKVAGVNGPVGKSQRSCVLGNFLNYVLIATICYFKGIQHITLHITVLRRYLTNSSLRSQYIRRVDS